MSIAQQILGILDENQDKIQEGFYLELANQLMTLYKDENKVSEEFKFVLKEERDATDQLFNENRQIRKALRDEQEYSDSLIILSGKLDLELKVANKEIKRLQRERKKIKQRRAKHHSSPSKYILPTPLSNKKKSKKVKCVCGCSMLKASLKRHIKTKKHKQKIEGV